MADYVQLTNQQVEYEHPLPSSNFNSKKKKTSRTNRLASLDVFRGLSVSLMIFVDYAGSLLPSIGHSPWNAVHLADFVMPFFLFIVGVSLALVYKNVENKVQATYKAVLRAIQLFVLGIFLQGGYFHGITSLTFGVDVEDIRWLGILQRISLGYIVTALCEIWLPCSTRKELSLFKIYYLNWCLALALCIIYSGLLYGIYVSDWQFEMSDSASSTFSPNNSCIVYTVKCAVRGDLGPACNSAGMIDRYILGVDHLYKKPVYRNLKECSSSQDGEGSQSQPPWCLAPFDPEGILRTTTAGFSIGYFSHFRFLASGLYLPMQVDVYGCRHLTFVLEWMGIHSLGIFVLITSNLAVIAIQGFYWNSPNSNIINWVVTRFVHK